MLKRTRTTLLCTLACTFFFSTTVISWGATTADPIAQGRTSLFSLSNNAARPGELTSGGIQIANVFFQTALQQDPTNQTANLFAALTAILNEINSTSNGTPSTIGDMLIAFGYTADNFGNYSHPASLPTNSPTGNAVTSFLTSALAGTIDTALANLGHITPGFQLLLTAAETGGTTSTEIDYGDILAMKSLLQFGKSFILLAAAYDLDNIDIDEMIAAMANGTFNYNQFMAAHTALLTPNTSTAIAMATAKTALIGAIDSMAAAIDFIDNETDDQNNDLLSFGPQDEGEKQWFLANFAELKNTLTSGNQNSGKAVLIDRFHEGWNFYDPSGNSFWLGFERDSSGNIITGEFNSWRQSTMLPQHGNVKTVNIVDSNITFHITSAVYSQNTTTECTVTLTGTLNATGDAISNGIFNSNCPSLDSTGTFGASQTSKNGESFSLNISAIFDGPLNLRAQLPEFVYDPYTKELMKKGISSLPDPTIGGLFPTGILDPDIDKVTLWNISDANGTSTRESTKFKIWTYDLPLNNITSAWIYPPYQYQAQYPWQIPIDLNKQDSFSYNYRFGTHLQAEVPNVMPDGWYTFLLQDDHYKSYRVEKYLTNRHLDPVSIISPSDNSYNATTTPTLSWNVTTYNNPPTTSGNIYYRIEIRDWARKTTIYLSDRQTATSLTIPALVLKADTPYKWRVQAFDSDTGVASNNIANSPWQGFYTGSYNSSPVINWAAINSRVRSNIPDSHDQIQLGINFSGVAPWDVGGFNIGTVADGNETIPLSYIDIRENGYFFQFNAHLAANNYTPGGTGFPDGNLILGILDTSLHSVIAGSGQLHFTFNRLPVPELMSTDETGTKKFQTTTPTFSWLPAVDETAVTLYYKLKILDKADNIVYKSHFTTNTSATVPPGYLLPNCGYFWKVQVYDDNSTTGNIARNRADSKTKPFFITPEATANSAGSLTGTISPGQSGYPAGTPILIGIFDHPVSGSPINPLVTAVASNTGSYSLYNLPTDLPLYIYAFWDQDHNSDPTPGEWAGEYSHSPLIITNNTPLQNIDLALTFQVPSNRTIINFDNMNSDDITSYLSKYGITITNQSQNSQLLTSNYYPYNTGGVSSVPSSMPTYLYHQSWSTSTVSSFTLTLNQPVDHFTFTRTAINIPSQTTLPEWGVTTLDSNGQQLDSVNIPPATSSTDLPAQTFNLSGPNITKIVFYTDKSNATYPYIPFDDFILEKSSRIKGDINGDDRVNLNDLVEAFKIISGQNSAKIVHESDSNGDGKIGLADVLYILKNLAR